MTVSLTEFPREFAPLLKNPQNAHQLGETGIVPGPQTPVDDPALTELATAVMRTTVNTYPELDYLALGMPEFRQWVGQYEQAWLAGCQAWNRQRPLAGRCPSGCPAAQ